jgi:hypothetical protein
MALGPTAYISKKRKHISAKKGVNDLIPIYHIGFFFCQKGINPDDSEGFIHSLCSISTFYNLCGGDKMNFFQRLFESKESKKKRLAEQFKSDEQKSDLPPDVFEIVKRFDTNAMQTYINSGGNLNAKNHNGLTVLTVSAMNSCYDIAKLLIDAGADVNIQSGDGLTALMAATSRGFTKMMKLLIEANADLELKEKNNGFTALTGAIVTGHIDAVRLLIEAGADVNSKANFERTALMAAAARGETDMVKLLIEAKADVNAKETQAGYTALIGAERNGHSDVVNILKAAGAKVQRVKK